MCLGHWVDAVGTLDKLVSEYQQCTLTMTVTAIFATCQKPARDGNQTNT